jgi:hypothetical protein
MTLRHRTNQLLQRSAGTLWERAASNFHEIGVLHQEHARILRRAINAHFSSNVLEDKNNQLTLAKDEFTNNTLPALKIIAESFGLMKKNPAFQNWTSADWLLGLTVLAQYNTIERKKQQVNTCNNSILSEKGRKQILEKDVQFLQDLLQYVRICDAVYANTIENFCQEAHYTNKNILRIHNGGVFSPKFILLKDDTRHEVILVVRGSASILDFCTDLCLVNEPFQDGQGHRGMVHAADWLVKNVKEDLKKLVKENPTYKIVLTGHSLGAGVASLATIEMKSVFDSSISIQCIAFATPASVTMNLAISCYEYVTTIINGDDCVPRLHQHSMLQLQEQVSCFDWRSTLKQMIKDEVNGVKQKKNEIYLAFKKIVQDGTTVQAKNKFQQVKNQMENKMNAFILQNALFKIDQQSQKHLQSMKKIINLKMPTSPCEYILLKYIILLSIQDE